MSRSGLAQQIDRHLERTGAADRPAPGRSGRMQRKPCKADSSGWNELDVAAEAMQEHDRRAVAVDLELDLPNEAPLIRANSRNSFSSTPISCDLDPRDVAGDEIFGRLEADPDAGRGAGRDDVAGTAA